MGLNFKTMETKVKNMSLQRAQAQRHQLKMEKLQK
jgi:hypothetical protein